MLSLVNEEIDSRSDPCAISEVLSANVDVLFVGEDWRADELAVAEELRVGAGCELGGALLTHVDHQRRSIPGDKRPRKHTIVESEGGNVVSENFGDRQVLMPTNLYRYGVGVLQTCSPGGGAIGNDLRVLDQLDGVAWARVGRGNQQAGRRRRRQRAIQHTGMGGFAARALLEATAPSATKLNARTTPILRLFIRSLLF